MKAQDLVLTAEANLLRAARVWAEASMDGGVRGRPGMLVTRSRVGIRSFNQVFLTGELPDRAELKEVISEYAGVGLRFRLRLRQELEGSLSPILVGLGMTQLGGIPCMALIGSPSPRSSPRELEIQEVVDEQGLSSHVRVVAQAFEWPPDELAKVFTPSLLRRSGWRGYVGYVNDQAVATSQLVMGEGAAGVYYVATLAGWRRRGFGEALTRHALSEGQRYGCSITSLQASPMGHPIYEQMGFKDVGRYVTYVPALDGT